jgi:hypothetical protein
VVAYAERLFGRIRSSVAGQVGEAQALIASIRSSFSRGHAQCLCDAAQQLHAQPRLRSNPPGGSPLGGPQAAPTTLKAAFLEPMCTDLATEVSLELFAKTDTEFMGMFTGGCRPRRRGEAFLMPPLCGALARAQQKAAPISYSSTVAPACRSARMAGSCRPLTAGFPSSPLRRLCPAPPQLRAQWPRSKPSATPCSAAPKVC